MPGPKKPNYRNIRDHSTAWIFDRLGFLGRVLALPDDDPGLGVVDAVLIEVEVVEPVPLLVVER